MQEIKKVTLDSIKNISDVLSTKTKNATKKEIEYKVLKFISKNGNNVFINFYNKTFSDRKFEEALKTLNI